MPITTQFNGEFIATQMTGVVTLEELLAHAGELEAIESSLPVAPHRIANLTAGTVGDFSYVEMDAYVAKRRVVRLKNRVKSAIVVGDAVQFGFSRMFQTLNNNPDIRVEIFQSEEPALAWLRE
jgi:hypothetical protein